MAYTTIAAVRAEGITDDIADDNAVTAAITLCCALIDRYCRQWFEARTVSSMLLDGSGTPVLFLPLPVITITDLKTNNASQTLDPIHYRVYNNRTFLRDDRKNPKLVLDFNSGQSPDLFTSFPMDSRVFMLGAQNQEVSGDFGFVESDLTTPLPIQQAALMWVLEKILCPPASDAAFQAAAAGVSLAEADLQVVEERTDDHTIKYDALTTGTTKPRRPIGLSALVKNPAIMEILNLYRSPIPISSPDHWTDWVFRDSNHNEPFA